MRRQVTVRGLELIYDDYPDDKDAPADVFNALEVVNQHLRDMYPGMQPQVTISDPKAFLDITIEIDTDDLLEEEEDAEEIEGI